MQNAKTVGNVTHTLILLVNKKQSMKNALLKADKNNARDG